MLSPQAALVHATFRGGDHLRSAVPVRHGRPSRTRIGVCTQGAAGVAQRIRDAGRRSLNSPGARDRLYVSHPPSIAPAYRALTPNIILPPYAITRSSCPYRCVLVAVLTLRNALGRPAVNQENRTWNLDHCFHCLRGALMHRRRKVPVEGAGRFKGVHRAHGRLCWFSVEWREGALRQ